MDALILGSLMILASGSLASLPSSAKASGIFCSGVRESEKLARILPAREMSLSSNFIPELAVNALRMGSNEYVASAGASSVLV